MREALSVAEPRPVSTGVRAGTARRQVSAAGRPRSATGTERGGRAVVFAALAVLAVPWAELSLHAVAAALVWALATALIFGYAVAGGRVLTGTVLMATCLAYSNGLGGAVVSGVTIDGYHATAEGAQLAALSLLFFLVVVAWSARLTHGALEAGRAHETRETSARVELSVLIFLGLCFLAALGKGMLSNWGGAPPPNQEVGAIRLELLYGPTLLVALTCRSAGRVDGGPPGGLGVKLAPWQIGAFAVNLALLFVLQSRRLMIAVALIIGLGQALQARWRLSLGVWLRLGAVAVVMLVFAVASTGWRSVSSGETVDLRGRFDRAVDSIGDTKGVEAIESRLTYLWFDAIVLDMQPFGADADGLDLLASELARAVPRIILPSKDSIPVATCETALDGFGLPQDLPCTPTGEGLLLGGVLGVLMSAILAGLLLGFAEALVGHVGGLGRVFGLFLIHQAIQLEAGVFSFVSAVRLAILGTGFIALIWLVLTFVGQRRAARSGRA